LVSYKPPEIASITTNTMTITALEIIPDQVRGYKKNCNSDNQKPRDSVL
jgi:hypothetical protein